MATQLTRSPVRATPTHLLSVEEAATYLNVPQRWVADALRQRRIRYSRIGKHIRFRLEHLNEFITACEHPWQRPATRTSSTSVPERRAVRVSDRHSGDRGIDASAQQVERRPDLLTVHHGVDNVRDQLVAGRQ